MKLLLLCAGYGTRLEKDLQNCNDDRLKSLKALPKPLIPISGHPLISHWVKAAEEVQEIDGIIIVTNAFFYNQFVLWKSKLITQKPIEIVNDGTTSNENRLGAIADILLVVQEHRLQKENLMIVAGDTLFYSDFSLPLLIEKFFSLSSKIPSSNLIVHCPCAEDKVHLHGIVELEREEIVQCERVISFLEKPNPEDTLSRTQSPCCYLIHAECLKFLEEFLATTKALPLSSRDAPGNFLAYLISNAKVFSFGVSGRFDIGNLQSYLDCCEKFSSKIS